MQNNGKSFKSGKYANDSLKPTFDLYAVKVHRRQLGSGILVKTILMEEDQIHRDENRNRMIDVSTEMER